VFKTSMTPSANKVRCVPRGLEGTSLTKMGKRRSSLPWLRSTRLRLSPRLSYSSTSPNTFWYPNTRCSQTRRRRIYCPNSQSPLPLSLLELADTWMVQPIEGHAAAEDSAHGSRQSILWTQARTSSHDHSTIRDGRSLRLVSIGTSFTLFPLYSH
jgi:hypothetical protein